MCRCESGQRKGRMQYFSNLDHVLIRPTKTLTYTTWQCKQTHALAHAPHMRIEKAWARAWVAWAARRVPSHEQTHAQEQTHAHTHTNPGFPSQKC